AVPLGEFLPFLPERTRRTASTRKNVIPRDDNLPDSSPKWRLLHECEVCSASEERRKKNDD
ncbi:MAG TPA: hypothetical protein VFB96_19835, partial [Pirellulaceae bacterium]|nr:hypothetical protein [Pirellulaceae bacterium]